MGFYGTTHTNGVDIDAVKVGTNGAGPVLAGVLFAGYALAGLEGWERVGARWVTVNRSWVATNGPQTAPADLRRCSGPKLRTALHGWTLANPDTTVFCASEQSVALGRQFKPAYPGGNLETLLRLYDTIMATDGAAMPTYLARPLFAVAARHVEGIGGGWDTTLAELSQLRGDELRFG